MIEPVEPVKHRSRSGTPRHCPTWPQTMCPAFGTGCKAEVEQRGELAHGGQGGVRRRNRPSEGLGRLNLCADAIGAGVEVDAHQGDGDNNGASAAVRPQGSHAHAATDDER